MRTEEKKNKEADIIIAGAGAAGLNLALALISKNYNGTVIIIDKAPKQINDRTWCFWESEANPLDILLYKTWQTLEFFTANTHIVENIAPLTYKMLRGIDFYNHAMSQIKRQKNFIFVNEEITKIAEGYVSTNRSDYQAKYIFNSTLDLSKLDIPSEFPVLLQHFLGYMIESDAEHFDPTRMTYMDFRLPQHDECRFMYVLPITTRKALVEFTVFSESLLRKEEYIEQLESYIQGQLKIDKYSVTELERGIIPMTDYPFKHKVGHNLINIGASGGFIKPSTGYSFLRSQRAANEIAEKLTRGEIPAVKQNVLDKRFKIYDSVLLDVLVKKKVPAAEIFGSIFKKNGLNATLNFLDERSSIWQELRIMNSVPRLKFIASSMSRLKQLPRLLQ